MTEMSAPLAVVSPPAAVDPSNRLLFRGLIRQRVHESIAVKEELLGDVLVEALAALAAQVVSSLRSGGKLILFGNGGSAADATHIAAEFVGRFVLERAPMPALSLSDNVSSVTAIGNDYDYSLTFARQLRAFGSPLDVAIGLSTSGASANVVNALDAARQLGMFTAAFTGIKGHALADLVDLALVVPSEATARVQEGYMLYSHILCELVEQELFGAPPWA